MDRRTFISAMTASMIAPPLVAIAQHAALVRRIGVLAIDPLPTQAELTAEAAPLRALGWVEGQNLLVEPRYANGRAELLRPFAEELVRLKVEIIGTLSTPATLAAKNATSTIPIVIWSADDPVGAGLVASLSRPGGNVTGLSLLGPRLMQNVSLCCASCCRACCASACWRILATPIIAPIGANSHRRAGPSEFSRSSLKSPRKARCRMQSGRWLASERRRYWYHAATCSTPVAFRS